MYILYEMRPSVFLLHTVDSNEMA